MKNLKLKFKIAINALFAAVVAFDVIEFAVKYVALSMGKITSIDMNFGLGDFAWIIGLSVLLIGYVVGDLIDNVRELKSEPIYENEGVSNKEKQLAAVMYQVGGVYDLPENVMNVLSLAQNGEDFYNELDKILPIFKEEK